MNKYLVLLTCFLCGCASLPKEVTLVQPLPQHQYIHVAPLEQHHYMTPKDIEREVADLQQKHKELADYLSANGWNAWEIQHDIYESDMLLNQLIESIDSSNSEETVLEKERLIKQYTNFLIEYKEFELNKRKELESLDKRARSLGVSP